MVKHFSGPGRNNQEGKEERHPSKGNRKYDKTEKSSGSKTQAREGGWAGKEKGRGSGS